MQTQLGSSTPPCMEGSKDRVRFNVGGRIFETTSTTLANAGRASFFGAMLDDDWNPRLPPDSPTTSIPEYFIDRNPDCFEVLLDLLRTRILCIPPNVHERLLYKEAQFYGLTSLLRAAQWGPMDGNRLSVSHSVVGRDSGEGIAIRASPDGGCCTVHGSLVHVYDWTLHEKISPFNLDYQMINDVQWIDSDNIVVSAWEKAGELGHLQCKPLEMSLKGGIGMFSSSTGELTQRFRISHGSSQDNKSYTAGALSYNSKQHTIFASCRGRFNEYGVGAWDRVTGQQLEFFYDSDDWYFGDADRLQWLDGYNALLVTTMYPHKDNCYMSLLDFRSKKMVWSWSDMGSIGSTLDDKRIRDVVAMQETVFVVNGYGDLGFLDLRGSGLRWKLRSRVSSGRERLVEDESCFSRLAAHQGQLLCSMDNCVSVLSGPDWIVTSRVRSSSGGSIYDFSIGGDRLFALHNEGNVFDVLETPPPFC